MSQTDRRVRKTKAQLRAALTALMREKDVKEITVRELTERADLNRGTFYCHYKDIYDMMEQVQGEVMEELTALLNSYSTEQLREGLLPILSDVFRLVERNADLFTALLSGSRESAPMFQLSKLIYEKVLQDWWEVSGPQVGAGRYYLDFIVAGILGVVGQWLAAGRRESPEEMAAISQQIIQCGAMTWQ